MDYKNRPSKTLKYDCETSLSCLAVNKDSSQVVVAGRNIIQVFSVDSKFKSIISIYKSKNSNGSRLSKSGIQSNANISDIAWSLTDQSLVATASTNGSVTIWNLSRQLVEQVTLTAHSRSANKVLCCEFNSHLVLSASQDGTIKLFDIKEYGSSNNPNVSIQLLGKGRSSPIRDVQFCPYQPFHLAVANENGELQVWDVRQPNKYITSFTCHSCPIMSIDWYPEAGPGGNGWLATGGCRDHLIKVWELSNKNQPELVSSIRTSNVNRICWRKNGYQLASSSNLNIDLNVHVWDIKRPYIPYASFDGHTDLITGIQWSNDSNLFFSVGKEGLLVRHSFADAEHLVNSISPIAMDISPFGKLVTAVRSNNVHGYGNSGNPSFFNSQPPSLAPKSLVPQNTRHKFSLTKSILCQSTMISQKVGLDESFGMNTFINLAKQYKLKGESLGKMCFYNSEVAKKEGQTFLTNLWLSFNHMFHHESTSNPGSEVNSLSSCTKLVKEFPGFSSGHRQDTDKVVTSDGGGRQGVTDSDTNKEKSKHELSTGNSDDNSDSQIEEPLSSCFENSLTSFDDPLNFLFENCDQNDFNIVGNDSMFTINQNNDYHRPSQDFDTSYSNTFAVDSINGRSNDMSYSITPGTQTLRSDQELATTIQSKQFFTGDVTSSATNIIQRNMHKSHVSSKSSSRRNSRILKENNRNGPLNMEWCASSSTKLLTPKFYDYPAKFNRLMFTFFQDLVDQDCVQTVCTAIVVIGSKLNLGELSDTQESYMESWFQSYINLLSRYKLWTIAAQVIKLCPLSNINALNMQSTSFITKCGKCNKILDKYGTICTRHGSDNKSINCSICHSIVRGLFLWCQGCGHGGHKDHIQAWFKIRQVCPTGCSHRCQFA